MSPQLAEEIEGLEHLNRRGWRYISTYAQRLAEESEQLQAFEREYVGIIGKWLPEMAETQADKGESLNLDNANGEGGETPDPNAWLHQQQKQLYRQIAKRCHPDVVGDGASRSYYTQLLQQVNDAYANADSTTLRGVMLQLEREQRDTADYLHYLRQSHQEISSLLAELRAKILQLQQSPAYQLQQKFQQAAREGNPLMKHIFRQCLLESE